MPSINEAALAAYATELERRLVGMVELLRAEACCKKKRPYDNLVAMLEAIAHGRPTKVPAEEELAELAAEMREDALKWGEKLPPYQEGLTDGVIKADAIIRGAEPEWLERKS